MILFFVALGFISYDHHNHVQAFYFVDGD